VPLAGGSLFRLSRRERIEVLYLLGRQASSLSRPEAAEAEASDPGPHEFPHGVAEAGEHSADLAIAAFAQGDFEDRPRRPALEHPDVRRPRPPLRQVHPAKETHDVLPRHPPRHGRQVRLRNLVSGVREPVRERPVVRHHQETFGVRVEPAHGEEPRRRLPHQIHRPRASGGVVVRADDARGLVEDPVFGPLGRQPPAVEANVLGRRVGLGARLGHHPSVDADAAFGDERFARPPRGDARAGENLLETFERHKSTHRRDRRDRGELLLKIIHNNYQNSLHRKESLLEIVHDAADAGLEHLDIEVDQQANA